MHIDNRHARAKLHAANGCGSGIVSHPAARSVLRLRGGHSLFSEAVEALPGCLHITIPDAYHAPVNHSQSTSRLLQHQCTRHMARLMIKPKPGRPAPGLVLPSCLLRRRQSDNTSLIALGQSWRGAAPARSRPTVCRMPEAGRGLTSLRLTNC